MKNLTVGIENGSPARNTSTNITARHSNATGSKFAAGESSFIGRLSSSKLRVSNVTTLLTLNLKYHLRSCLLEISLLHFLLN